MIKRLKVAWEIIKHREWVAIVYGENPVMYVPGTDLRGRRYYVKVEVSDADTCEEIVNFDGEYDAAGN